MDVILSEYDGESRGWSQREIIFISTVRRVGVFTLAEHVSLADSKRGIVFTLETYRSILASYACRVSTAICLANERPMETKGAIAKGHQY